MNFLGVLPELDLAIESVRAAALLAEDIRLKIPAPILKPDGSPVTLADFACQALIISRLRERFPKDIFVAEEDSSFLRGRSGEPILARAKDCLRPFIPARDLNDIVSLLDIGKGRPGPRFWTLDPIDGTKGFIRGGLYAVALALVVNGNVEIGVLGCPRLRDAKAHDDQDPGTIAFAWRGHGAWYAPLKERGEWKRLAVSKTTDPKEAVILGSYESRDSEKIIFEKITHHLGTKKPPVLMDALAKYLILAAGGADLLYRFPSTCYEESSEWIWDQASGAILVEEAGGKVTDLTGQPLDFTRGRLLNANRGVLLSNTQLHAPALAACNLKLM